MRRRQHDQRDGLAMMPWYPRDWRASTARASLSKMGRLAYLELLSSAWLEGGSLPSEDRALAGLAGFTVAEWGKVKAEVLEHFEAGPDGRLRQKRLAWEYTRAETLRASRRAGANHTNTVRPATAERPLSGTPSDGIPSPTPSPSPTPVVRTLANAPPALTPPRAPDVPNPLVAGRRVELEREALHLAAEVAELQDKDPIEVMQHAAHYEGARSSKLNPATMSDDRLANTVMDLRATLQAEKAKPRAVEKRA